MGKSLWVFGFIIVLILVCEICAQTSAQLYLEDQAILFILIGALFYGCIVFLLSKAQEIVPMAIANATWSGMSIITISLAGLIFFSQQLRFDQMVVMAGVAMSVVYLALTSE